MDIKISLIRDESHGSNVGDTVVAEILGEDREVTLTWVGQEDGAETGEAFQDAKATVDGEEVFLGRRARDWREPVWSRWTTI